MTPDVRQPDRLYAATHNTATGGGLFFTSTDAGRNWTQARNLDVIRVRPFVLHQDVDDPNLMYLGTNVGIFKSIDRGASWSQVVAPKAAVKPVRKKAAAKKGVKKTAAVTPKAVADPSAAATLPAITQKVKVIESLPGGGLIVGTDSGLFRTN